MNKTNSSREVACRNSNEGTSARTRPISLEEILSKRKKKLKLLDVDGEGWDGEMKESSVKDNNGVLSEGVAKKEDVKDTGKGNSSIAGEATDRKKHEHSESKDEGTHELETKTKLRIRSSGKSGRGREEKNEKPSDHRVRTSNLPAASSEKEFDKQQAKASKEKDKYEERDRRLGKEGKRKHESRVDDKNRTSVDGSSVPKRHDTGKLRDAEHSERKDNKKDAEYPERRDKKKEDKKTERSRTHHEEPRPKRRRSRSREHDRERKKSASLSPRRHRHSNYVREYDEPIFQSSKDKSRRKYSETDKFRSSENGGYGSGHYRRHGSGLGGYSPRKRRPQAAIKAPSPPKHSPERKASTWDQPPAGINHGVSGSNFAILQSSSGKILTSSTTVTPIASKPQPTPSAVAVSTLTDTSVDSVQLTQATRPMRQLYIEHLPPSVSEKSVIDCLNEFLLSSGVNHIQGAKPCISCIINKDKGQAVVEFLTPEYATSAISFDGKSLSGSTVKIRRPKDFVEAATGAPDKIMPTVKAISEVVKDSAHKIFVGGISEALSSDMLLEVVGAFGTLKAYHFEFKEELKGPCAFLEYEDHSITQKACAGLNGIKLGGHVLTAVQAFLDTNVEVDDEDLPSYDIPSHAKSLLGAPTQVLQLKNVLDQEELLSISDSELEEILEDIRVECTRFGSVKSINVVRFDSKIGVATEASNVQDAHAVVSNEKETIANSPSGNCKSGDVDLPTLNSSEGLRDVSDDAENKHLNGGAESREVKDVDSGDYEQADCANVDPTDGGSPRLKDPSVSSDILSEEFDVAKEKSIVMETHVDTGNGGTEHIETTNSDVRAHDGDTGDGDGDDRTHVVEAFEAGCVLVEFLRKEAACSAAHCLHGRSYGERVVSASYVSHDLYLSRFPR